MQTKQTVSLQFLPEYNAYGISDKEVKKLTDRNIIPVSYTHLTLPTILRV